MTFEPVEDDDQVAEVLAEHARGRRLRAAQRPPRRIGPLTRRRARLILTVLTYFGPTEEDDLYGILRAGDGALTKALLHLAANGMITCEPRFNPFNADRRIWSISAHSDGED